MDHGSKKDAARLREAKANYHRGFEDGLRQTAIAESFVPPTLTAAGAAIEKATALMSRPDGWLRINPDEDGKIVWVKWKFTSGRWANHYVLYKGENYPSFADLLVGIHYKLVNVDMGQLRPSKDQYFSK